MGTFTQLNYQVVFGGKNHNKFLLDQSQDNLFAYIGGILKNLGCIPHIVGGHQDHIHLVYTATGKYSVGKIVQEVKTSSHAFIKNRQELFPEYHSWQIGYGAFSYRKDELEKLIEYVRRQKVHHQSLSFKEEYIQLLKEHGIEFELKYLFI
jgi:putative transposase